MDDADAAEVVALVINLDPYRYGFRGEPEDADGINDMIDAWALTMSDVDGNCAKRAVVEHYRTSGKRISIADVIEGAQAVEARDRAAIRAAELRQRREDDRRALPPAKATRNRTQDIAALLARHRNWSPIGDLSMRRRQASEHPDLEAAYRRALREKAAGQTDDQEPAE